MCGQIPEHSVRKKDGFRQRQRGVASYKSVDQKKKRPIRFPRWVVFGTRLKGFQTVFIRVSERKQHWPE